MPFLWQLVAPSSLSQLSVYYLSWTVLYLGVNIGWDALSPRTPAFHVSHLSGKVTALYNAVSFASSLLLLVAIFSEPTRKLAGDTVAPMLLAALSGLMVAASELCPYKLEKGTKPPILPKA